MGMDEAVSGILGIIKLKKECEAQIKALLQAFEKDLDCRVVGVDVFSPGKEIMEVKIKLDL